MHPESSEKFDIVIVGSGIACTSSLRLLIEQLKKKEKPAVPVRIAVIEKDKEYWTGLPYGNRSSLNSLIITTLGEFIHPEDKTAFLGWLEDNRQDWVEYLRKNGGEPASVWLRNNEKMMLEKKWDEIYIPRFLYGNYLLEKIRIGIETAAREGIATVELIQAEAIDLIPGGNGTANGPYTVVLEYQDGRKGSLFSDKVLLAVGSPPMKTIPAPIGDSGYLFINDIYAPGLDKNISIIQSALSGIPERENRNILIMGSNASSLELLYMINHRNDLKNLLHQICVISYSGLLPHRITPTEHPDYRFENLLALKENKKFSSDELMATIEKDVEIAYRKGVHIGDTYYQLSDLVVELQSLLDWDQQKHFSNIHGMRFTKLIRRAGAEYRDAAEEMIQSGKLKLVKGKFLELVATGGQSVQARYISLPDNQPRTYPAHFPVVVNCGGFEDLPHTTSRIIASLIARKICRINSTNRGFEVNEKLEAAPDLYIMGPLLGGIFNKQLRLWHVENAKRIHTLALLLAETLTQQL